MLINIIQNRWQEILSLTIEHLELTIVSLIIVVLIAVPLGIFITRHKRLADVVINIAGVFQTIPSLALLGFMIPFLGIGSTPAIVALSIYGLLPIIRNTYVGITGVNPAIIDAGVGMGMTNRQILFKIELPLSMPVIMGGIRTATVLMIGVATLATLVGAGGLGDLIFRGIATANQELILAGAIPAALLAIIADFLLKNIEVSLQSHTNRQNAAEVKQPSKFAKIKKPLTIALGMLLLVTIVFNFSSSISNDKIVIGGKNYTEQDILVYLMAYTIEGNTNLKVDTKPYLGSTTIVAQAIDSGDLDIYAEYTGTALVSLMQQPAESDPEKSYNIVSQYYKNNKNIIWLKPFGYNNTYTITVRSDAADELGLKKISDLKPYAKDMVLSCTHEFAERPDGYPGLAELYGIEFGNVKSLDPGLTYAAVRDNKADACDAFSTDGRIIAFNLRSLEDDMKFFPDYSCAPIVRKETLDKHPEIADALGKLKGKLTQETMQMLNAKVDLEKQDAKQVALEWLKANKIIK